MATEKEIKKAILDVLNDSIDKGNYGLNSRYRVDYHSVNLLHVENVRVDNNKNIVTKDGTPIYKINRRHASRKQNGMYKELTPTITAIEPLRERQRLFVDMDGTLAVFTPVDELETLYQKGYFINQAPHENVVAAVREIIKNHPEIDVHILSAYLTDSEYALDEKNEWLDKHLPEIDQAHRVFVPCGSDKKIGIEGGVRSDDFLLDDYTHNLNDWQPPARGIKLLNAINHTRGSWEHDRIRYDRTPKDLADGILSVMQDGKEIYDDKTFLNMERSSEMAKDRNASELASRLDTFMYDYDTYSYADEVGTGEEERQAARDKIERDIVNGDVRSYFAELNSILSENEDAEENTILNSLIEDLRTVQENRAVFSQAELPIDDIAILDYVRNPDRNGTGGLDRASEMFHAAVVHTVEADYNSLYTRYDNAWTAANLNNDFQPKIAILQLGEGDKNHNRRFSSMEVLRNVLHEQPSVENYELVYVRNEESKTENPMAQSRLCNSLYAEFNADTLRPRNYYGHSLSVGDVIVIANDFSDYNTYFVDDMGFTRLPDNFLSREMIAKISNNFDVSKELAAYENVRTFEAEKGVTITDEASVDRVFELSSEYTRIFEMADRRGAIMDMNSLGYEPARYDGFSENNLLFKKVENEDETISFENWEKLKDFVAQSTLNNSGFHINGFEVKDMVYMANYTYNGENRQSAVWKQGEDYYISTGSKVAGNLTRHNFTDAEKEAYNSFLTAEKTEEQTITNIERSNEKMAQETEKPDLLAGDIMEYEGKQWRVKSNDGFMLSADNLDENDNNSSLSWIGNVNSHDYTLIARAGQEFEANKGSLNIKNMDLVANVQGIEFYANKSNPTLIIAYNENYHIEGDEDVQKACERIFNNYYSEELTEHLQRQKEEWDRISTPIPNRYYEPSLDLDGTAEELYVQARNGYIENPEALHRISEILSAEGESDKAERVSYMEERENEDTSLYSVAQMKLDFMDGQYGGIDDVAIAEGLNLTVVSERDTVLVSLTRFEQEENEDVLSTGAASMSLDEFKKMTRADFERFVNEVNAYNMVEQERTPNLEKEQELNHGDNEIIVIDGHDCVKIDEWQNGTGSYELGGDNEDNTFFYARVTDSHEQWKGVYTYEYDRKPTQSDVEQTHLDKISEMDIDKHEAEFGADGSRNFPNLNNDERITLHIRYAEPRSFNGFNVTQDSIVFDNMESMEAFVNGEATYDHLDNSVRKQDNEILQYAENADGEIVWGVYPIREFTRSDNGQIAEGSTIPALDMIEAGQSFGHANRTVLYNAVQEFEQRNKVERPVIDSEGNYEDKDLLYGGYDEYIARSHQQELSGYADRLTGEHSRESNLAEIYYGLRNGLNEQQIDSMIEVANLREYNSDMLRTMRYGYQSGQTLEQVATYSHIESSYVAEAVRDFMNGGATPEQLDAIRNLTDQSTAYVVIDALRDGMDAATAKIIVDNMAELQKWNTDQWNNNTPTEIRSFDYERIVNAIRYSDNVGSLTNEMVSGYIEQMKADRRYSPFDAYVENFNHRDKEKEATRDTAALHEAPSDEELSPKDKLKQQLENGVKSVLDSENFKNWLSTGGKLFYNNYSFNNAMLVWLQKPEATYVMGYEKWKDFGRNVAQGAQGAKIFIPLMASEKFKGGLYRSIKNNLNEQLSKDPSLAVASYRLGTSNLEFTMSRSNHLVGFKVNGQEQQLFSSDEEARRFIDRAIIGKVPTGFTVGTVFDAKDVITPEYLWLKTGFSKEEIAPDEKGNPMKNRRGETRIVNTPERQARFQTELNTTIAAKDPVKMEHLLAACIAASERKGVPVSMAEKDTDEHLKGGAKGYYSRQFTEDKPKGFIVLDNSLEITEKCAVLLHEMGHADLHNNLEALANRMGENKITKSMREVQAEATAYATASTFGIETDTSSFTYLAAYSKGFELQDFQKSLEVIFKETQALTADIKAELDLRGLNLDLTEMEKAPLDAETLKTLSTKYVDFATEQGSKVTAALAELPSLVKQNAGNPELIENLKYQKENLDIRKGYIDSIMTAVESLNAAETRDKQDEILTSLDASVLRTTQESNVFENQTERFMAIMEQAKGGLKVDFEKEPLKTLEAMKKDFPALSKLTDPQLTYIATSKFVSREYVKLLRNDPQEFVSKVTDRAEILSKVAAKNGTFVEINYCEQWTDKPFFEKGTLCSPKIADTIVAGSEAQARGFKDEAEKRGEYFPYTKCDVTIFTPSKDGGLLSYNTRVDIGDGAQTSLKDHLEQTCKRGNDKKEVLENFSSALTERANKNKIKLPSEIEKPQEAAPDKAPVKDGNLTHEEWGEKIGAARDAADKAQAEKAAQAKEEKTKKDTNRGKE